MSSISVFAAESAGRRIITLSATAGVLLVLLVSWRSWRRVGLSRTSEVLSDAQSAIDSVDEHEATEPSLSSSPTSRKHSSTHDHKHHHKHTKSLSSSHGSRSTHDHGEHTETEHLLHSRARTQPNYSGSSHHTHGHREDGRHSPRILPLNDMHEEPTPLSPREHAERGDSPTERQSLHGRAGTRNANAGTSHHSQDYNRDSDRSTSADDLDEKLRRHTISYLEQHPEDIEEWEVVYKQHYHDHEAPRPGEIPGKRYRDLAFQEARARKIAFEESKRAYNHNRKAEAKRLSEEGKVHDENAKRYNALAAAEIFNANNPRRQLSRCDLHGLHVDEAMAYARDHVVACRAAGADKTMLIVGRGSHSQQGTSRIRPAIMSMLSQTGGVVAGVHEKNEGCIVVEFAIMYR